MQKSYKFNIAMKQSCSLICIIAHNGLICLEILKGELVWYELYSNISDWKHISINLRYISWVCNKTIILLAVLFMLWPHMIDFCIVFKLLFVHIFFYFLLEDMKENYETNE